MYRTPVMEKSSLSINESIQGEPIEHKLDRIVTNGEGVEEGAPAIYTERKDGVLPAYDIRTDKWDVALDAMGAIHDQNLNKRMTSIEERKKALEEMNKKDEKTENKTEGGDKTPLTGGENNG